jgi:hypothetical protein
LIVPPFWAPALSLELLVVLSLLSPHAATPKASVQQPTSPATNRWSFKVFLL